MDNRKSSYNHNKLRKRLRRLTGQAIADYNMIEEGDRVMVCLSGGKDSYTMLDILLHLQRSAPIPSNSTEPETAQNFDGGKHRNPHHDHFEKRFSTP